MDHGLVIIAGTIDPNYHGEVKVCMLNISDEDFKVTHVNIVAHFLQYYLCID